ncbi:MAG TPA: DUF5131 family protein [Phycisphaerae bacterium]|nr:DUF5131 family protein [Phycisphaerae bacterium]
MSESMIETTEWTWNPWLGCTRISPACDHCHAGYYEDGRFRRLGRCCTALECEATRPRRSRPTPPPKGEPYFFRGPVWQGLRQAQAPMHWKTPRLIFVGSRTDMFHESIPNEQIYAVMTTIRCCPQHTFQLLTKRPDVALEYFKWEERTYPREVKQHPLPNVWFGVTVEDQPRADIRIPLLVKLRKYAALTYMYSEPMLGPIKFCDIPPPTDMFCPACDAFFDSPEDWLSPCCHASVKDVMPDDDNKILCPECNERFECDEEKIECPECGEFGGGYYLEPEYCSVIDDELLGHGMMPDWVVTGSETARPRKLARATHPDWVRSMRDQCADAGVLFFHKSWGEWWPMYGGGMPIDMPISDGTLAKYPYTWVDQATGKMTDSGCEPDALMICIGKKHAGQLLDGEIHDAMPTVWTQAK